MKLEIGKHTTGVTSERVLIIYHGQFNQQLLPDEENECGGRSAISHFLRQLLLFGFASTR